MRATITLIAAAAVAAPLLVSATPSPSYTDLYAREEVAPYVSARDAYGAAAIFRRGNSPSSFSKKTYFSLSDTEPPSPEEMALRRQDETNYANYVAALDKWNAKNVNHAILDGPHPGDCPQMPPILSAFYKKHGVSALKKSLKQKREYLRTRALIMRAVLEELD